MANSNETDGKTFRVIGTRPIRHDGVDKVTGRAKYGADYAFPGMLHGKILRSPHAHAVIKSIKIGQGAQAAWRQGHNNLSRPAGSCQTRLMLPAKFRPI